MCMYVCKRERGPSIAKRNNSPFLSNNKKIPCLLPQQGQWVNSSYIFISYIPPRNQTNQNAFGNCLLKSCVFSTSSDRMETPYRHSCSFAINLYLNIINRQESSKEKLIKLSSEHFYYSRGHISGHI